MNGFIILDKDKDLTSFKANAVTRGILGIKKTGHTGTLDPMATGVLPVALGGTTKFIELLPCHEKSYTASFKLGETTDTLDITGSVTSASDDIPDKNEVISVFGLFTGIIKQLPPMYSAIKKNGVRLYTLARQGIEIEREEREVDIKKLEFVSLENGIYTINVDCSEGTYIRSLISDIGDKLGCGAVMTGLRRTSSNGFSVSKSHTLDELREAKESGTVSDFIIPTDKALESYDSVTVSDAQAKRFSNGGELDIQRLKKELSPAMYRVYSPENVFLGLGEKRSDEPFLRVRRLLVDV